METFGGELPKHPLLVKQNLFEAGLIGPNYALNLYQNRLEKALVEGYLACLVLSGADNGRYLSLKNKLENSMLLGSDNYPKSREDVIQLLNHYKEKECKWGSSATRSTQEEVTFLQKGGGNKQKQHDGPRTNSKGRSDCFHCKKTDHLAYQCPNLTPEKRAEMEADFYKVKQQHVSVHTQVGVVVEVGVSMLVKG